MKRASLWLVASAILLAGCGASSAVLPPTPTPLPSIAGPEKPSYTVERGTIVERLTFMGRVSPVEEARLFFREDGRVLRVHVARGDTVRAGDLLAELDATSLRRQLSQAQLALETARADLAGAEAERVHDLARARLNLDLEQIALDKLEAYDPNLDVDVSQAELNIAAANLQQAQADHEASAGLPESEREARARALQQAELAFAHAEAAYRRAVQQAAQHQYDVQRQQKRVELARLEVDRLATGVDARLEMAVTRAELELADLEARISETVILAPIDGQVTLVDVTAGEAVQGFEPVIVVADPGELEVTAELSADEVSRLAEGQGATVVPTEHPDRALPAVVRLLPYPFGSGGGAGDLSDQDRAAHLSVDLQGLALEPGDLVRVTVVLQRKEGVLWLPPAAIRTFQGRKFVVVQEGAAQRMVDVTLGIESETAVEVVSGLEEGQIVVGP